MATRVERTPWRSEDGRISLVAGRIARVLVRARIAYAYAGIGQAIAEGVGNDAALNLKIQMVDIYFDNFKAG